MNQNSTAIQDTARDLKTISFADVKVIAIKELTSHILDLRFLATFIIIVCLYIASLLMMVSEFREHRALTDQIRSRVTQSLWFSPKQSLWLHGHDGYWQFTKNNDPVTIFAGISYLNDRVLTFKHKEMPSYDGDLYQNPLLIFFRSFDFLFLTGVFLSLIVFLLSFDSVSGEIERGTLKTILAGPVSRGTVITGKVAGGLITILIPYITASLISILLLLGDTGIGLTSGDTGRILLIILCGCMYLGVIYFISVCTSIFCRQSALSLVSICVLYIYFVFLIPSAGTAVSNLLFKKISQSYVEAFTCETSFATLYDYIVNVIAHKAGKSYYQLTKEQQNAVDTDQWEYYGLIEERILKKHEEFINQNHKIDISAQWINRLSPFGCLQNACMAIANIGPAHQFFEDTYNHRYFSEQHRFLMSSIRKSFSVIDISKMPVYQPPRENMLTLVLRAMPDIVLLALYGVFAFLLSYFVFVKKDLLN